MVVVEPDKVGLGIHLLNDTTPVFDYVAQVCIEDTSALRDAYPRMWQKFKDEHAGWENLIVEKYSCNKEKSFLTSQTQIEGCYFMEYERAGSWIIYFEAERAYCDYDPEGICGLARKVNETRYADFLKRTNLTPITNKLSALNCTPEIIPSTDNTTIVNTSVVDVPVTTNYVPVENTPSLLGKIGTFFRRLFRMNA